MWQAIFYTYKFKKLWNKTLEPYGWLKANTAPEYWILFCTGHPHSCQACISSPPIHHVLNWICLFCTLCILFFLGKKKIIDFSVTKSLKEFSILFFTSFKSQTRVFLFLKCACPLFIHFEDYCINLSHPTAHLNHHSNSLDTPDSATQKSIFSSWSST